jgi:putative peptidoglycan lipid II flippase
MSETRKVTRRAGIVAASTLASRVLGMVRDMTIASLFSAAATDVFFVAFTIPNTLRRLVGEGALTISFVPVMTETLTNQGRQAARRLVQVMTGTTLLVVGLLTVLGTLAAPWLVWLYGAGLARFPGRIEAAGTMTQVMFPYLICASLLALAMGALNSVGRFFAPSFAPVLLNVAMIGCSLALAGPLAAQGIDPLWALAGGVLIGGLLQVAWQLPAMRQEGFLLRPQLDWNHPGLRAVLRLMGPGLLGVAVYQINIILSRTLASFLPEGSVTYLYYAFRLVELPQGLFIYALAGAMLPSLSGYAARQDFEGLRQAYRFALRTTVFITLPAAVGLGVLALPVVAVIFQRGAFDATCALQTAWALVYQAPGIVLVAGVRQTAPVFYALKDTKTPVVASVCNLLCYLMLALLLMGPMLHAGISLAITLAAGLQLVVLTWTLRRKLGLLGLSRVLPTLARASVAAAGCGAAAWWVSRLGQWEQGGNNLLNIGILALAVAAGAGAYVVLSLVLQSRELREIWGSLRRRRKTEGTERTRTEGTES